MDMMRNIRLSRSYTFVVVCFAVTFLSTSSQPVEADDVPAFFLKIAKNIPRVGRSGRFEDYFLKAAKNIPRIGKRPDGEEAERRLFLQFDKYLQPSQRVIQIPKNPSQDDFLKPHNVPRVGKRDTYETENQRFTVENENDNRDEPTKRMLSIPNVGTDDPSWSHFPLAIEGPPELWRTLAAYANERSGYGPDDIDNEIWHRDKRSENRQESGA